MPLPSPDRNVRTPGAARHLQNGPRWSGQCEEQGVPNPERAAVRLSERKIAITDHSPHGKTVLRELAPLGRNLRHAIPEV